MIAAEPILSRNARHFGVLAAFTNSNQESEPILPEDRIVAVGLLTQRDLEILGPTFTRVWPVEEAPAFSELLRAIDEADRNLDRTRGPPRPAD
jgi:hypothetical protein